MPFSERAVQGVEQLVAEDAVANHPTLVAWHAGRMSRDELRTFARVFFHLIDALPRTASRTHSATAEPWLRRPLLSVLTSLDGNSPTLSELWLQTCAALGLSSDAVRRTPLSDDAAAALAVFERHASTGPATGTAVLYTLLRELPAACRLLCEGMRDHYGVAAGPGAEFFDAFAYQAPSLTASLRDVLVSVVGSDADARYAREAAEDAQAAFDRLLHGALAPLTAPV